MTYRQKRCGLWKRFAHILMTSKPGVYVTGSGFVLRSSSIKSVHLQVGCTALLSYRHQFRGSPSFGLYRSLYLGILPIATDYDWLGELFVANRRTGSARCYLNRYVGRGF